MFNGENKLDVNYEFSKILVISIFFINSLSFNSIVGGYILVHLSCDMRWDRLYLLMTNYRIKKPSANFRFPFSFLASSF